MGIRADRPATSELRRLLLRRLHSVRERVVAGAPDDVAIHALRSDVRKARALARLLRPALRRGQWAGIDRALRTASRVFGSARDARVILDTLAELQAAGHPEAEAARAALETSFAVRLGEASRRRDAELATAALGDALGLVRSSRPAAAGWPVLAKSLRRSWRRVRRAMRAAAATRDDEPLHVWRKRVKVLTLQLLVLEPAWRGPRREHLRQLQDLCDVLGRAHDLAVLGAALAPLRRREGRGTAPEAAAAHVILGVVESQGEVLGKAALARGERLFAGRARDVVHDLGKDWRHWRRHAQSR